MPRKKNCQPKLSKRFDKKIAIEDLPMKTMQVTIYALRWIFFLIFVFMTIGIFALFISGGESFIQVILTYSITGFFTFFMGYFGWILAQGIIEMITGKEHKEDHTLSYYLHHNKQRFRY